MQKTEEKGCRSQQNFTKGAKIPLLREYLPLLRGYLLLLHGHFSQFTINKENRRRIAPCLFSFLLTVLAARYHPHRYNKNV